MLLQQRLSQVFQRVRPRPAALHGQGIHPGSRRTLRRRCQSGNPKSCAGWSFQDFISLGANG